MNTTFEREIKDQNYTVMCNYHLRDKNISLKAKGLLSQLLSYSPTWALTIKGLCAVSKEQESAIKNTIRELENFNYLTRLKLQNEKGRFYYKYIIHEKPKYPYPQNPGVDNPGVDNQVQRNTNIINTNKEDKIDKDFKIDNKSIINNNLILKKLVNEKYINIEDLDIYKYDELIREMLMQYDYSDIIKSTGYIISLFKQHNGNDEYGNNITNKFGYYKESLLCNLRKLNSIDDLDWMDDIES